MFGPAGELTTLPDPLVGWEGYTPPSPFLLGAFGTSPPTSNPQSALIPQLFLNNSNTGAKTFCPKMCE